MTAGRKPLKIRTAEYDRMADAGVFDSDRKRMELLGGQLYEMPPIGTPHLIVVTRIQRLFERHSRRPALLANLPSNDR